VRQTWQKLGDPPIPVSQLVAFVFDQDPGDWIGNSLFRPCFREWLSKDLLYRIDTVNHEKAGGVLITEGPRGRAAGGDRRARADVRERPRRRRRRRPRTAPTPCSSARPAAT
jgi:hypothetical protein